MRRRRRVASARLAEYRAQCEAGGSDDLFDLDLFDLDPDPTLADGYDYVEDAAICRADVEDVEATTSQVDAARVAADRQQVQLDDDPDHRLAHRPGRQHQHDDVVPELRPLDRLTPLRPVGPPSASSVRHTRRRESTAA